MICATRDIILLNKRLDKVNRQNVYMPVQISGVSVYDARQSSSEGSYHTMSDSFKIRIPMGAAVQDGRSYLPETQYDDLDDDAIAGFWTLHTEDAIVLCASSFGEVDQPVYSADQNGFVSGEDACELAQQFGFQKDLIHITGYADNTLRGSDKVKHWRIGGA